MRTALYASTRRAAIDGRTVFNRLRLTPLCSALAVMAFMHGSALAQAAATVMYASGDSLIRTAQGVARPAKSGGEVLSGDTIETGKGRVQLRMVDGALMSLQADTTLRLDDYHLASEGAADEKGYMSLVKGGLRTISGLIGKARPANYRVDTAVGTIGIRGTEYTAVMDQGLKVGVVGGKVSVCNDGGCVDVIKGSSAFTSSKAARPSVSAMVAMLVPPATATAPASLVAVRSEGEQVRSYLQSLVTPQGASPAPDAPAEAGTPATPGDASVPPTTPAPGSAAAPGGAPPVSFSPPPTVAGPSPAPAPATPAPATPEPAPAPAPGQTVPSPAAPSPSPTPSPVPAPAPGPATPPPAGPAPAPTPPTIPTPSPVVVPMTNGLGSVGAVWETGKGGFTGQLLQGYRQFDGGALTDLQEKAKGGKKLLDGGTVVNARSDGIVAWGRWTDGKSDVKDDGDKGDKGKGDVTMLHYFTFAGTPALPIVKAFASFGSTAPTITSNGRVVAVGQENAATGTLNITFPTASSGFATYKLAVPVAGQTFSLTGTAAQTGGFGFAGGSVISSTGSACAPRCAGSLASGNAVQGLVGGTGNSRAGINYGFTSGLGNVAGAIVFKP